MDLATPTSSVLPQQSVPPVRSKIPAWILRIARIIGISLAIGISSGGIIAAGAIWLPYNRVVVFDQPPSSAVRVSSIRMTVPGFVVIFLKQERGWGIAGSTSYLMPGYYRDIVIPLLNLEPSFFNNLSGSYIVRIYKDTGDRLFEETTDIPIKDVFGKVYAKRFFMSSGADPVRELIAKFLDQPLVVSVELLFP